MCIMYGKKVAYLEIPCSSQEFMGTRYQQLFYGHKQLLYFPYSFCYSFHPLNGTFTKIYCNPKCLGT